MWLTLVAAATLVASTVLLQREATDQGLRASVAAAAGGANVVVERDGVSQADAFDAFQASTATRIRQALGAALAPGARYASSASLVLASIDGIPQGNPLSTISSLSYYAGMREHVHLVAGHWPAESVVGSDWQLTASARTTDILGTPLDLKVGSEYCFTYLVRSRAHPPETWCGRIAATWLPNDPADPYWAGHVPETSVTTEHDSFFQVAAQIPDSVDSAVQQWVPDAAQITSANATHVVDALNRLRGSLAVSSNDTFVTGLDSTVTAFLSRQAAASGPALVTTLGLILVALAAMAFAALQFIEAHRAQAALWRVRGWPRRRVFLLVTAEFTMLALAAVPFAAVATAFIAGGSGAAVPHPALSWASIALAAAPAAIAAGAFLAILAGLSAVTSAAELSNHRGRRAMGRRSGRRLGFDIALGTAGAAILVAVHASGSDTVGVDPSGLLLWAPVLGVAMMVPASLRLVETAAHLLSASPSLGARLARWQLARDPAQYARLCLLVTVAVAVGVFASTYSASDRASAVDRADYQVGAYVRATFSAAASPPQLGALASTLPSGNPPAQVFRGVGRPGRSGTDATVLGVPGLDFTDIASTRSDFAPQPLATLVGMIAARDPDGLTLKGTPHSVSLSVYSSGIDGRLLVGISDAAGRERLLPAGSLNAAGWREASVSIDGLAYPVRIRSLRVEATGVRGSGDVAFQDLRTNSGAVLESFSTSSGWWRESFAPNPAATDLQPSATRLNHGRTSLDVTVDHDTVLIEPPPVATPLPVLLASQTMTALGLAAGQTFPLHIQTVDVQLQAVGTVDDFPTYYPAREDLIVAPMTSLLSRLGHEGSATPWPNELWIGGASNAAAIAGRLAADLNVRQILSRPDAEATALADPLRVGLRDELTVGFIVALAVMVIGFALHFLAAARGRVTESAIMRANGVPESVIRGGMVAEQLAVLASGLVAGTAIGLALAWAVVPLFHAGTLPEDVTPAALLHLDPPTLAAATVGTGALALAVGRAVAATAARVDVMAALRSLT